MNWSSIIIAGAITYFTRFAMITLIRNDKLNEITKLILAYVPAAVFPAIIFPAVLINENGALVEYNDSKIIAAIVALIVGYYSKNVITTILSGLISYWLIIYFL
tara:strand:- start:4590 stop:4901 length:312 start_codon:yes stop_codon:yes gene_type:complete